MFVEGAMTRRAVPRDGVAVLKKLDADIVVIPEFGVHEKLEEVTKVAIQSLGYQIIEAPYEDWTLASHVPKRYEMALLTRLSLRSHTLHHFTNSNRAFIEAIIELPGGKDMLRVFGVHLDDKTEESRLVQIAELGDLLNKPHVGEVLVMGDFNAMTAESLTSKILRTKYAGAMGKRFITEQLRSMSERVNQMAIGSTIATLLEISSLHDLDGRHRFTISGKQRGMEWFPAIRLAKIDWIFGSKNVHTIHYKVLPDSGSDHRPVIADIELAQIIYNY